MYSYGGNCSALVDTLLESQLFGYVRGAFIGATDAQPGLFEYANGGAVFLEEVGETSLAMQAKLLRGYPESRDPAGRFSRGETDSCAPDCRHQL